MQTLSLCICVWDTDFGSRAGKVFGDGAALLCLLHHGKRYARD